MEEYLDEDSFLDYQEDDEYTISKKQKRNTPKKYSKKQDFCDMCDKKVTNAAEHKRLFHKTGKFKCYLCNFNLSTLQKVRKHILESHEEDFIPYATQMGTQVSFQINVTGLFLKLSGSSSWILYVYSRVFN